MNGQAALSILLIEDNPDHAALAKAAILTKAKNRTYAVEISGTAEEAMEFIQQQHGERVVGD